MSEAVAEHEGRPLETRNLVLNALCPTDRAAVEADIRDLTLASGDVLYEPARPVEWVYFPQTAVLSVITVMLDGRSVESDTVGCESVVGVLPALGTAVSTGRTLTQIPGLASRIAAARLRHHAEASPDFRKLLIRHSLANLAQAHQSVACNALHTVNQRLCRWLLMSQDRTAKAFVELTHEYLAMMVGVHRSTITEALRVLADNDLVRNRRRSIEILDRPRMEAQACECYGVIRANLHRLTGAA